MRTLFTLACAAALFQGVSQAEDLVVRAGTIHPCGGGEVLTGGAAIWIQDGKIKAIGKDVQAPLGTPELDYGSGAVIAPGLVSTQSGYGTGVDPARAAAPFVLASDNFNPYFEYHSALRAGVTTAFLEPGAGDRLIAGQGAVIKLAGEEPQERLIVSSTGIVGSIAGNARFSPGFWEPRLPATVDMGLGFENRQFPRTVMGAVIALRELIELAQGNGDFAEEYGTPAGEALAELIRKNAVWRLRAETDEEVAALVELFGTSAMPLVIEGLELAPDSAALLAQANHRVIFTVTRPSLENFGKDPDTERPRYDVAAKLAKAGVPFAIQGWSPTSLRFAAGLAMRGGLDANTALEAITSRAAEALGVGDRVGSLRVGRDGDLVVYNGDPLNAGSSVLATLVNGDVVYDAEAVAQKLRLHQAKQGGMPEAALASSTAIPSVTVLSVQELHVGDGEVLRPGELLIQNGKITEVAQRVSRPAGAKVVQGYAAMPGAIDVFGFLGMEGANPRYSKSFEMARMVEPGDSVDRLVALAGTTTVNMTAPGRPLQTTTMVYKPAEDHIDHMIVRDRGALLVNWPSGATAQLLHKEKEYSADWAKYYKELAAWKANPPKEDASKDEEKDDDEEKADEEDDDKKKKKKKNKDKPAAIEATGSYEALVTLGGEEGQKLRLRLLESEGGALEGTLRMADYPHLVLLTGQREEYSIRLDGMTSQGGVALALDQEFEENDVEKPFLKGRRLFKGIEDTFELPRTSPEYPVAKRPIPTEDDDEDDDEPKGKPKPPSNDVLLDMLVNSRKGEASVFVFVDREDHIRSCVDAFARAKIKPVLVFADDAHEVIDHIRGKVAGVVLSGSPVVSSHRGLTVTNRFARLQNAGIPVAFASQAEEGAAGLIDVATMAAAEAWSPAGALRALTADAASMLSLSNHLGTLQTGRAGDVLLLDGPPLTPSTSIVHVWVNGEPVSR